MAHASTPESFVFPQVAFVGEKGCFICIDYTPTYVYDKDKHAYTDKRSGKKVEAIIPNQRYERIFVQLPMGFDDVLVPDTKLRFEGFEARFYRDFNSGEYFLSAKAASVVVIK